MGKPLSRPDCLRKRLRCFGKREEQDGYIEDCYVPQRSIYDTMRINEHIDQGPAPGDDSTLSSNGTPAGGAGAAAGGSTKRLDERVIFDSLKLTAEAQGDRSPVGGGVTGGSVSPSVSSTGSAPCGGGGVGGIAVVTRRRSQGSDKRDQGSGRRSWKSFTPPERLDIPAAGEAAVEKPLSPLPLTPSPLICPYPPPPPALPAPPPKPPLPPKPRPHSARGPLPSPPHQLILPRRTPSFGAERGRDERRRGTWRLTDSGSERDSIPDQDLDTAPLLPPLLPPPPESEAPPSTCTWPRRLMGRRRTVSQGGVLHKLPILPPLPPLLAEHSEAEEDNLRLLDTPPGRSQEHEGVAIQGVVNAGMASVGMVEVAVAQGASAGGLLMEGRREPGALEEEVGWEEVLQKVDSLWEETEPQGWGPSCSGSLGPWPILPPPLGFGGPDSPPTPSPLSSGRGSHDPLPEAQLPLSKEPQEEEKSSPKTETDKGSLKTETDKGSPKTETDKGCPKTETDKGSPKTETVEGSPRTETDGTEEPLSEHARQSDSSGIQLSNPDQTASSTERGGYDSDLSSAASLDREEEEEGGKDGGKEEDGVWLEIRRDSPSLLSLSPENPYSDHEDEGRASKESPLQNEGPHTEGQSKTEEEKEGEKEVTEGEKEKREEMGDGTEKKVLVISSTPISEPVQVVTSDPHKPTTLAEQQEADPAVTTVTRPESPPSRTDSPLPLSPSKHEVRGSGLESGDADAFVVTDSFVYLAVSALPPFPPPSLQESAPPSPHLQPRSDPEEADFLSTDSFVYLAAPERHPLAGDGSSAGNSQDSDSDAGQSGVDFALGSTTADSDSDASESEPEPEPEVATSIWDPWEDLEPAVLHWLFYEDQSEKDLICEDQSEKELPSNNQSDWGISGPGGPACRLSPGPEVEELDDSSPNEEEVRHTPGEVEMAPLSTSLAEEGGFLAPDEAAVPLALFWETHSRLEPWLQETEALLAHLPPPAIDLETLRQQQDQLRVLKESIAGHQCHVDKLLLIGPVLDPHSQEGATMRCSYSAVEQRYHAIKEGVKGHSAALEEAISQSSQFYDKLEPLLETLERAVQRLRQRPPVAVELERIREQLAVHRAAGQELDKLLPSYNALCSRGDDPTAHVPHANPADPASQVVRARLRRLRSLWEEIRQRAQEREGKLLEVLDLAGKFWAESGGLLGMLREAQDITRKLEDPAVSPAHIRQQLDTTKAWRAEVGRLSDQLQALRSLGDDLITACGDTEKTLVKKTIDETYAAWDGLSRSLGERKQRLEEALSTAVQYQDALQGVYGYLDNAGVELRNMPAVGKELSTVRQQLQDLKRYKQVLFRQQRDMQKVRQQGELLLRSASAQSEREAIQKPLTHLTHLWRSLGDEVTHRQHELEVALLCLGQFQQALMEAESWLSQSHVMLDTLRPISCDPKAIEMELANHQVLRDDEFSHRSTMETINRAGAELLEASSAQEASLLRQQLDTVNQSWDSLVLKTQDRQALLEEALLEAKGFHSEVQDCLQWLRCTERQLSAAKPTGGLPETAREQLRQHMELQGQLCQQGEHFQALLERGRPLLMTRPREDGVCPTQIQQDLLLLQNMWTSISNKMGNRRAKLEEAVALATGFQSSLQVCVNWLIQAEQSLNMAPPPSLILDTVLLQIDQHKVFVNEVNSHREQVLVLEKVGSQLRSASLEQDEVLISNLLLRVHSRWHQLAKSSLEREQHLEEARQTAKKFQDSCGELWSWLLETENELDSELRVGNEVEEINAELAKHEELRKALCSKLPLYYATVRSGRSMREKATLPTDTQKLHSLLQDLPEKWGRVCAKSMERQQQLEQAVLFSGQCEGALQLMLDWLCWAETQLHEDQPISGDLDLVSHLLESHQVFQRELSSRTSSVQALKRAANELMGAGPGGAGWVGVLLQELNLRWDRVCNLSITKQTRLQQALKQAEQFRNTVQQLLVWLSGAGQARFRGAPPEEAETLQALLHAHEGVLEALEEKREEVLEACALGETILSSCHPDSITLIRQRVSTLQTRYREVLMWAKQHKQALESSLAEILNNSILLEELLSWLLWAETTLVQREAVPFPHDTLQIKTLIIEHQVFMEEMAQKQADIDRLTKSCQSKSGETAESQTGGVQQVTGGNPRLSQLCSLCQQVWQLSRSRQSKLNIALNRLEELEEGAEFDFEAWRRKCAQWVSRRRCHMMDVFRRMDTDQDGKITRQEFSEVIVGLDFPTSQWEMVAVMDLFDCDSSGHIDYYEFVSALHQSDLNVPSTDADKIKDEVTRQVVQCRCMKRFQVEQIGESKYRLGQFECSLRMLCNVLLVQVGHGWMSLNEFLLKYDPCRDVSCTPSFQWGIGRAAGSGEEQPEGQ